MDDAVESVKYYSEDEVCKGLSYIVSVKAYLKDYVMIQTALEVVTIVIPSDETLVEEEA